MKGLLTRSHCLQCLVLIFLVGTGSTGCVPMSDYHPNERAEARQFLRQAQVTAIDGLVKSGQGHLAEAFLRPMSDQEQSALAQTHLNMMLAATALQRAQAQPYLDIFRAVQEPAGAVGPAEMPPGLILPGQTTRTGPMAQPGQSTPEMYTQGALALSRQRPPTREEAQARFDLALQDPTRAASMLVAFGAATGQPVSSEVEDVSQVLMCYSL